MSDDTARPDPAEAEAYGARIVRLADVLAEMENRGGNDWTFDDQARYVDEHLPAAALSAPVEAGATGPAPVRHDAYVRLSCEPVHRTVAVTGSVNVDVDKVGDAVGVELLGTSTPVVEIDGRVVEAGAPAEPTGDTEPLSKLDTLIRTSILRYPGLFTTRWDVLRHLYLAYGNGFEWANGELVEVVDVDKSEEACTADFFSNVDAADTLAVRRRQFILDHLDLLVHEPTWGIRSLSWSDVAASSVQYSAAFNVPDNAEESFRAGAIEVLGALIPGLYYAEMQGWDNGLRAAACRERERLAPVDHEAMQRLIAEICEPRPLSGPVPSQPAPTDTQEQQR